jgi:membrane protein YdbS with pleckstrin-like domain
MDYKITCICGHPFIVSDEQVRQGRGEVACPACRQRLKPTIEIPFTSLARSAPPASAPSTEAAPEPTPLTGQPEPTRRCPFCGEVILAVARKCKHCGEFLDRAAPDASAAALPTAAAGADNTADPNAPVFSLYRSQWDNFWKYLTLGCIVFFVTFVLWFFEALHPYLVLGALAAMVFALFTGYFFYLTNRTTHVLIRPLRIDVEKGIFSKSVTALELFRITDVSLEQSLLSRLLGFGTLKLTTTDADSPEMILQHLPRAREVRHYLQTQIPLAARQRGAVYMEK